MQPEYEVHNFAENQLPRQYEAVYLSDDVLVKAVIYQRNGAPKGSKPLYRWSAVALAWAPGQVDEWINLTSLSAHEMVVRDVKTHEATEETWLEAARLDAEKLMERAEVFTRVISKATAAGRKGKLRAA